MLSDYLVFSCALAINFAAQTHWKAIDSKLSTALQH